MSSEINRSEKRTTPNVLKPISDKEGCLRASYFGCGLLVVVAIIVAIFVYIRLDSFFMHGTMFNISKLQKKLGLERTLTDAQYYEMMSYLDSIHNYIREQGRSKEAIFRFRPVYNAFKEGLLDNRLEREEIAAIRSAMLQSEIPIIKSEPDIKGDQQNK